MRLMQLRKELHHRKVAFQDKLPLWLKRSETPFDFSSGGPVSASFFLPTVSKLIPFPRPDLRPSMQKALLNACLFQKEDGMNSASRN